MNDILLNPVTLVALAFCGASAVYGFVRQRRDNRAWHDARARSTAQAKARLEVAGQPMAPVAVDDREVRRAQVAVERLPRFVQPVADAGPARVVVTPGRRPQPPDRLQLVPVRSDVEISAEAALAAANKARVSAEYDRAWLANVVDLAHRSAVPKVMLSEGPSPDQVRVWILDALAAGPLTLRQLMLDLKLTRAVVYRALAGLLTAPPAGRLVDYVAFTPGNPTYGLVHGVRALPRGAA